jgi:hypothetical protein
MVRHTISDLLYFNDIQPLDAGLAGCGTASATAIKQEQLSFAGFEGRHQNYFASSAIYGKRGQWHQLFLIELARPECSSGIPSGEELTFGRVDAGARKVEPHALLSLITSFRKWVTNWPTCVAA